jgi:hypothetical protein
MPTIISYPDFLLAATLSGGSWQVTAPLTNLNDGALAKVARSTTAAGTQTIQADLGAAIDVRLISVFRHNLTAAATIRARGFSDAGYTTMVTGADSGTLSVWPAGFTAADVAENPPGWTFCFSSLKTARYWKIEIIDTGNPAGYIELGRCWIGTAKFEPGVGVNEGMSLGYEARDVVVESLGGVIRGEKRTARRALVGAFSALIPAEKRKALLLQKNLTTVDEAFWVSDSLAIADDMLLEAFPCFIRRASPLVYPYYGVNEFPVEIIEKV